MQDPSSTDDDLVTAFRHGDAAAMETLYGRHSQGLLGWLSATLRDHAEAEDLSQEIWIKAIRGIDGFRGGNFRAWLWRTARNAAIDRLRRRIDVPSLDAPAGDGEDAGTLADEIPDENAVSAVEALEAKEAREAVRGAICSLSPPLREVVLLRVDSGMKFKDIAELLGLPLGTVLGRMNLAVGKLKKALLQLVEETAND